MTIDEPRPLGWRGQLRLVYHVLLIVLLYLAICEGTPRVESLLRYTSSELPAITRLLFAISVHAEHHPLLLIQIVVVTVVIDAFMFIQLNIRKGPPAFKRWSTAVAVVLLVLLLLYEIIVFYTFAAMGLYS